LLLTYSLKDMEKCVIYSRVSSDHQDYERQISDLRRYAEGKYIVDNKIFAEKVSVYRKKGQKLADSPAFEEMKHYVEKHGIKNILMWEISRLARNTANALTAIEEFSSKGVGIFFYKEGLFSLNREHKLTISILCSIAEKERDDIMARVSSGHKRSVENGSAAGYFGKSLPYGYTRLKVKDNEAGLLMIEEKEAKIIQMIFDWAEGKEGLPMSQRAIASRLNSLGIPTRWKKLGRVYKNENNISIQITWKPNAVGLILNNTLYKGIRNFAGRTYDAPKIIEPGQWDRVQAFKRKKLGYKLKETKYRYLLKGKIICGNSLCGRMYGCSTELRYNMEQTFYRCNGSKDITIKCRNGQFGGTALDEGVYSLLFYHKGLFPKMKEEALASFDIKTKEKQIDFHNKELRQNQNSLKRMLDSFVRGGYEDAYGRNDAKYHYNRDRKRVVGNIQEHEREIKLLSHEIDDFKKMKDLNADTFLNEIALYETDDFERKSEFVNKYINKVVFHKVKESKINLSDLIWYRVYRKDYFNRIENAVFTEGDKIKFYIPNGKDNFAFVEVFAFGSPNPVKGIISNHTKLFHYSGDRLKINNDGTLVWDKKPGQEILKQEKLAIEESKKQLDKLLKEALNNTI